MGRLVKRVPMNFDWPMKKVWYGYTIIYCHDGSDNGHGMGCDECKQFAKLTGMEMKSHGCPEFKSLEPPIGEGWQMWEDTSEGSPISPVFETPETLAKWLADTGASTFGFGTATYEQWLAMIKQGWAIGMIADSQHGLRSGVEACEDNKA